MEFRNHMLTIGAAWQSDLIEPRLRPCIFSSLRQCSLWLAGHLVDQPASSGICDPDPELRAADSIGNGHLVVSGRSQRRLPAPSC